MIQVIIFGVRRMFSLFVMVTVIASVHAQSGSQMVGLTARLPLGSFAESHIAGVSAEYNFAPHRFGDSVKSRSLIGFIGTAGGGYLFGTKTVTAGNDFRFGSYSEAFALAGAIINPGNNMSVSVSAGPVAGFYKGSSDLALLTRINGIYFITSQLCIGPVAGWRKGKDVRSLFEAGVHVGYVLK